MSSPTVASTTGAAEADRRFLAEYPAQAAGLESELAQVASQRTALENDRLQLENRRLRSFQWWRVKLFVALALRR